MRKNNREFQTDISDLPVIIHDNNVRLFDKTVYDKYDIINTIIETNLTSNSFYIIDLGEIITKYKIWREALPMVRPYYAVKCNSNPVILKLLSILGTGFDCASKNEISLVTEYNKNKNNIIYANPCKDISQIQFARANDVDLLTFDCETELYKVKLFHPHAKMILRIKTDDSKSLCQFNCKFGVDMDEAIKLLELAKTLNIDVVGVSFHVGSGCYSADPYRRAIQDAKKIFIRARELDIVMNILDIGGGFPGYDNETISFSIIAETIRDELQKSFSDITNLEVIAEPGRYFVTTSHTLVVNVIGKKELHNNNNNNNNKRFIYYINSGVYSSFSAIHFDHQNPIILPFNERDGEYYESTVFGPTCDSIDLITPSCMLPELAIGDYCFVENFGAYTIASSFNGLGDVTYVYILKY